MLTFKTNLKCNNCIKTIEPLLNSIPGINSWNVNLNDNPATLHVSAEDNLDPNLIINAIQNAGYKIQQIK